MRSLKLSRRQGWCWNLDPRHVYLAPLDTKTIEDSCRAIYLLDDGGGDLGLLCLDQCRVIKIQVLIVDGDVGSKGFPLTGRGLVVSMTGLKNAWECREGLAGLGFLGNVTAAGTGLATITLAAMAAPKPLAARLTAA